MKNRVAIFIPIIIIIMFYSILTSCGANATEPLEPTEEISQTNEPFDIDISGYVANISGANALGISKNAISSPQAKTVYGNTKISNICLLSSNSSSKINNDTESKNYLVMSSTKYDPNEPEANKTGLTKVTFTKIVTEDVTTETIGSKYVIANEGTISIVATVGFSYTVYHDDTIVYDEVKDNDANDKNSQIGIILLDNLIDGIEYKVNYKGVGVETTITQDELNGEIDKLYVINGYTFISFVPEGQSQRPNDSNLIYDYDGVSTYDKNGYYSSTTRQSFVIDNTTGYVYNLKAFSVDDIKNGIIKSSGRYYDMNVTDKRELSFTQIVKNETLRIYNIFKDKYGNKYVQNDYLNAYDAESKTVYYTKTNYFLSHEGIAIYIDYIGKFNSSDMPTSFTVLKKIDENFNSVSISASESYTILHTPCTEYGSSALISHIEDGYLYMYSTHVSANTYYQRISTISSEVKEGVEYQKIETKRFGDYGPSGDWTYSCLKSAPIDYKNILIWCDYSGTPKLYYFDVWAAGDIYGGASSAGSIDESKLTVLLENCVCVPNWDFDFNVLRFRYTTFSETVFYKLIIDENGIPAVVNSETYVAPERETITLQPINM